jgi:hypothetical protein
MDNEHNHLENHLIEENSSEDDENIDINNYQGPFQPSESAFTNR